MTTTNLFASPIVLTIIFFCQVAVYRVLILFDSYRLLLPVGPLLQVRGAWCVVYINKMNVPTGSCKH